MGRVLGSGAFARVNFAVSRDSPDVERAVKVVSLSKMGDEGMHALELEIRTLRRVAHPNICRLFECYLSGDDTFSMVLELCKGGELFDRIVAKELYSEREARVSFAQMVEAVGHCHQHEVVHRDLKPENVLYADVEGSPNGELLKVADFGLATVLGPDQMLNVMVGTPSYARRPAPATRGGRTFFKTSLALVT